VLLPFDIRPANDQCEAMERWVAEFVVLQNGFKRTALAAMIQFHFREPSGVERDRSLFFRNVKELLFGHE